MNQYSYIYAKTSLLSQKQLADSFEQLKPEIERIKAAQSQGYNSPYASINLPGDAAMQAAMEQLIQEKNLLDVTMLMVIGIGGSNLGTVAIHQALQGILYNETQPLPRVYFADTIDADYIGTMSELMQEELSNGGNVLINVITKSGTTTETIANFELLYSVLKEIREHARNYNVDDYVVVTTDEGSPLWDYAITHNMTCIAIPKQVGGRYSVFSPVGQFPLGMLGISVNELLAGAQSVIDSCLSTNLETNVAAQRALLLAEWYKRGFVIHDTFLFSVDLEGIGRWYRQLMGESIGKQYDRQGKEVLVGITPTVSLGTTDLHSVGQLYLGGPYNKATTFISVAHEKLTERVPTIAAFKKIAPDIQGKTFSTLMQAVLGGVQRAYEEHKRPFDAFVLKEKSAFAIGQLMQIQMMEMMYLGFLLNIDPFDQPNVELYKSQTRKLLVNG